MSPLEIIGTVLGVIGVWLMIRQNVWTWPVGLVQVAISAWVFYESKLYSDVILQVFYFVIQAYGWWHWRRGCAAFEVTDKSGGVHGGLPVTRLRVRAIGGWIGAGTVGTAVWGEIMRRTTDAALPHWDAFILVFALIAQWLQARKRLENWAGWMVVNLVSVGVYWAKDLRLYAGLAVVFFAMAVGGHLAWKRDFGLAKGTLESNQDSAETSAPST
jgi:nicotinamide mononucleotide transporter